MEKKVLYINACARSESRTDRIARALLERLGGLQEEVKLAEMDLQPLSEERLNRRTWLIEEADYTDAMFDLARQFQQADEIVIAAPYWDLSFPAILKLYLENIYVTGLVSEYTETGRPHGLCLAGKLWYVTTAGGPYLPDFSYQYLHLPPNTSASRRPSLSALKCWMWRALTPTIWLRSRSGRSKSGSCSENRYFGNVNICQVFVKQRRPDC